MKEGAEVSRMRALICGCSHDSAPPPLPPTLAPPPPGPVLPPDGCRPALTTAAALTEPAPPKEELSREGLDQMLLAPPGLTDSQSRAEGGEDSLEESREDDQLKELQPLSMLCGARRTKVDHFFLELSVSFEPMTF